ncbi:diaminopimelate epimerase [Bernardetia litoralis DSM 6794]|uniref:Diaminopimelate epimerase n=1 Tax=Bernardetia litoralis (strain ATCC 23117 / DSM 6794 / NBRC 15988 / NCIMB 1366 / Fx l1 / Sio-4) TaxID=880071 RepID=I4ANZ7_BERLS|nr:diaminopimelate epimerase [Bernardetia litoralis]AFM05682.1 diaminopimelate epimerase [Bernardetia litoralis DSM 6794]
MKFYKYQGTGNDFIMIDNRDNSFSEQQKKDKDFIENLCHRRFGIGADGLILIENSTEADFTMVYFNSDGNLGSMCGNGGRCAVAFAYRLGVFQKKETTFMAFDGLHFAKVANVENEITQVELQMSDISEVEINLDSTQNFYYLNTGSPHYVTFLNEEKIQTGLENYPIVEEGKKVRYNERFKKEGTNVNFVANNANNSEKNSIFVRTYERGVEDETLSCGTGVTACALAYFLNQKLDKAESQQSDLVHVRALGGNLKVRFTYSNLSQNNNSEHNFTSIFLIGAATAVFEGII